MCSAPNVYMFVYTLIGAQIVPLITIVLFCASEIGRCNTAVHAGVFIQWAFDIQYCMHSKINELSSKQF